MNNNLYFNGLSFTKIITGLNKGLGLINQALPLYEQLKPIFKNANSLMSIVKEFNTPDINDSKVNNLEVSNNDIIKQKKVSNNLPTFFQ